MKDSEIGVFIALGLSFFFLYNRKKKWNNVKINWVISGFLCSIGLSNIILGDLSIDGYIFCWEICVPIVFYSFDRLFRYFSLKIYNRDFILWLRHSEDIDGTLGGENPHVKSFDIVFSLALLIIIISTTFTGIVLFSSNK